MKFRRSFGLAWLLAAALAGAVGAGASPLPRVGDLEAVARPPGVPLDYVVTPNGLFHPSCVGELGEDDRLTANGDVLRANGHLEAASACAYPRFAGRGQAGALPLPEGEVPSFDGWIADSESNPFETPSAQRMVATFTVPSLPRRDVAQVLYYFPGLASFSYESTILQPVLGWWTWWGSWTMTNWNCCKDGKTWHGPSINVATGDKIQGSMTGSTCAEGFCAYWKIVSKDKTTGKKTKFVTESYGQAFVWYFGGAMEVYGVSACSDFPANGSILFKKIHVYDLAGDESTPEKWLKFIDPYAPPCNYRVKRTMHTTTITFNTR